MITVHVPPEAQQAADGITAQLDDLVVAYAQRISEADSVPAALPAIEDGGRWYSGDEVPGYLAELRRDLAAWRKFQSDACYIDDDGSVC